MIPPKWVRDLISIFSQILVYSIIVDRKGDGAKKKEEVTVLIKKALTTDMKFPSVFVSSEDWMISSFIEGSVWLIKKYDLRNFLKEVMIDTVNDLSNEKPSIPLTGNSLQNSTNWFEYTKPRNEKNVPTVNFPQTMIEPVEFISDPKDTDPRDTFKVNEP